ncbi:uncharacterized protein LOC114528213 isoform X2 [Dendronephthya gigantea]|uniref:uncharacterized protein LOC114528213 isoform X2 n=1 Tax=Dendronephthya gigantea TaxID=151771 RepID=UPI00106D4045|nr:uncharacterized protein LOC114528213 isoform X2 [Dendronephthya gigantea]XP_028405633.1 uncharacterized protein LOC114528213 isoform X2 [Dendronephthya gigantea]XP_028405635.1 uncharacterized protein LOC114528213 isoform X2 [Dendronephthya gigantea]
MSENKDEICRLNPIARAILQGLYDEDSPLHKLLGLHYVLKAIWSNLVEYWKSKIIQANNKCPEDSECCIELYVSCTKVINYQDKELVIQFPKPSNININMMPFVMAKEFKETKLPKKFKGYFDEIIKHCIVNKEMGEIGYLTIHESYVDKGTSQRRPGLHTESPGVVLMKDAKGCLIQRYIAWGLGLSYHRFEGLDRDLFEGGIYMASNVANSCKVWNCEIVRPGVDCLDIVGKHGDIEHLREFLPVEGEMMEANTVYWITDRTPHESLPLTQGTYRQYFRLVTSLVSVWYQDHSTENPNGVVPNPKLTKIVKGSKFDGICSVVDP